MVLCLFFVSTATSVQARDHVIINVYLNEYSLFYKYSDKEDVIAYNQKKIIDEIINTILDRSPGQARENKYSIVVTELNKDPGLPGLTNNVITGISFNELSDQLLLALSHAPNGPNIDDEEIAALGMLKYINSKLAPTDFFDKTYIIYAGDKNASNPLIDRDEYNQSVMQLKDQCNNAKNFFKLQSVVFQIQVLATLHTDMKDEDFNYHDTSCVFYFSENQLLLINGKDQGVSKSTLVLDRLTQTGNKILLIPSEKYDTLCTMTPPFENTKLMPNYGTFIMPGFTIPLKWCLCENDCRLLPEERNTSVAMAGLFESQFPLYSLIKEYLVIPADFDLNNNYGGQVKVTGNLVNGIYDHLPYTASINFTFSIVPPTHFKLPGRPELVLDNHTLLLKSNELFNGNPVTQKQVIEKLTEKKNNLKIILLALLAIMILFVIIYYFFRKNEKVTRFMKRKGVEKGQQYSSIR
ncbi:MAG: hypothetical protein QM737_01175 [Ferruginibacter sp.]